jgi:ATP-dependent RNA helicase DeaD
VDQLTETLNGRGYRAEALHGGMDQAQRDRVMGRLRSGTAELLVATDVAARGLDIDSLTHVVNFDVPSAPEAYVHRIGRVGRAGREGVAITLAEPRELRLLANIERLTKHKIGAEKVPTVADLRARQVDETVRMLAAAISETEGQEIHDEQSTTAVAQVIERLLADHDPLAVARVAVRLLHESSVNAEDEREIPDATPKVSAKGTGPKGAGAKGSGKDGGAAGYRKSGDRPERGSGRHKLSDTTATGQVWVGAGKSSKVRPQDLVGAIANETNLTGRQIGGIRVLDHYSVVEVPAGSVDEVIGALNQTMLRGKKVTARRYEDSRRR